MRGRLTTVRELHAEKRAVLAAIQEAKQTASQQFMEMPAGLPPSSKKRVRRDDDQPAPAPAKSAGGKKTVIASGPGVGQAATPKEKPATPVDIPAAKKANTGSTVPAKKKVAPPPLLAHKAPPQQQGVQGPAVAPPPAGRPPGQVASSVGSAAPAGSRMKAPPSSKQVGAKMRQQTEKR